MTCSLFHWHEKTSWGCRVSYSLRMAWLALFPDVQKFREQQGRLGSTLARGRVAPSTEGKDPCPRGVELKERSSWEHWWGWSFTSRVLFYCPLHIAPSKKEAEKRSSAYTSKEGPRAVVAPQEQHLAPHPVARTWCPLPHGVCCCCPRHRHSPRQMSGYSWRGVGRQWQVFTAYFSQTVTLWDWGISNSEQPGHFPNA